MRTSVELLAERPRARPGSGRGSAAAAGTTPCCANAMAVASTGADPDRQVAVAAGLLEQHDRLVGGHLDPDTHHVELVHVSHPTRARAVCRSRPDRVGRSGRVRPAPDRRSAATPSAARTSAACSRTDSARQLARRPPRPAPAPPGCAAAAAARRPARPGPISRSAAVWNGAQVPRLEAERAPSRRRSWRSTSASPS